MNIRVEKLTKQFGTETVLDEIDLDFLWGTRLALVGANGSGKSTLLRAMMGMIACQGKVHYTDTSASPLPLSRVKEQIAYVPQISPYFSSLVSDVVTTILRLRGIAMDHFIEHLETFRLNYREVASLPFRKLSGGMKQKLLISLAFAARPQVLLLDEPTASLDPESRESFYRMSRDLSKSSLLLCSHRLEEIQQLVDEVVVLDEGKVIFRGQTHNYLTEVLKKKY